MQTQFVLIILSLSFIKGTCSGQSISNEVLRERRSQALGQQETALTHPQSLARLKQQAVISGSAKEKVRGSL